MLDINKLREDKGGEPDLVRESQKIRGISPATVDDCIAADEEWIKARHEVDQCNYRIRQKQKAIAELFKRGEDASVLIAEKSAFEDEKERLLEDLVNAEDELHRKLSAIGNIVDASTPSERDKAGRRVGKCDERSEGLVHHEAMRHMGGFDFPRGVRAGGHRAYFLKGAILQLNQALQSHAMAYLAGRRYAVVQAPVALRGDVLAQLRTGRCAESAALQTVRIAAETCEESLEVMHMNEWLRRKELPLWYAAMATVAKQQFVPRASLAAVDKVDKLTPADGLLQVTQHTEIATMCLLAPEEHKEIYSDVLADVESFYQSLGLSYQVVATHGSELPMHAVREHVLQAWFPISGEYHTIGRVSHSTDFICRRMEIRCDVKKMFDHEKMYCHMIHGLVCSTERLLCCLVEVHQTPEGIRVPPALRPYLGNKELLPFS